MKFKNLLVSWWLVFALTMISLVTALAAGIGGFIAETDQTCLSWVILVLFTAASMNLGSKVYEKGPDADFGLTDRAVETCTSLGLLGTIIGLILMITSAFTDVDVSSHDSIQTALVGISSGVGTALITTLVGITCALLLQLQLAVVREKWSAK